MDILKTLLEALKLAPRYLVALGIAAYFLLFGSENFLKKLGVYDFTQKNRSWIGLVLIVTFALFAVDRVIAIFRWMGRRKEVRAAKEEQLQRLRSLTETEKQILRFYFARETKTNYLHFQDGVVQGLVSAGIIYQASSVGHVLDGFAFNISDFAWNYLGRNPGLLDGSTNLYRTDKQENRRY